VKVLVRQSGKGGRKVEFFSFRGGRKSRVRFKSEKESGLTEKQNCHIAERIQSTKGGNDLPNWAGGGWVVKKDESGFVGRV